MTRYLSKTLGMKEPAFSQTVAALEKASGLPSADIRLTSEIKQRVRTKIAALGLDPDDTTGDELYGALCERLKGDEARVRQALHIGMEVTQADAIAQVCHFLQDLSIPKDCFVIKPSVARRLLKRHPPRIAMKQLGYRSLDSLLKREPPALIYAAAAMVESSQWQKRFHETYTKLRPSDFESRPMGFFYTKTKRWEVLSRDYVSQRRQHILCFRELGDIVLLTPEEQIDGLVIATLLLSLEYMNDIRAQSSFAKLQQVKPDFGAVVRQSSISEPYTNAKLADQPVPWRMIQRYYGRSRPEYHVQAFEPHVHADDLQWHHAADVLATLEPSLQFWQDTQYLCVLNDDGPVSLNVLDVALSYCNHLPFTQRVVQFLRNNLWHELMMRYLDQQNLEAVLQKQLSAGLVEDQALAELA